ncbi:hypothetical protein ONR57_16765 [Hoyosella sp. YIM 151337]|uniref:hypothetical protein n=1 Tax=Hoyosella sp. YIM 151337 TaxID=2992742 RepID=UPI002235E6A4|nr:hypothetical protein [Hoyosella sp. YIM 151337]MCW4354958.1 hypothetical protein [Hoyosella sp. YIM 151337]
MARASMGFCLAVLLFGAAAVSWFRGVDTRVEDFSDLGLGAQEITWYSGPWLTLAALCTAAGSLALIWGVRRVSGRSHAS